MNAKMTSQLSLLNIEDSSPGRVIVDGHTMEVTEVFWTYWYLAAERQQIFMRRIESEPQPWTTDDILLSYRFTNAYRASDRVSQFLLQNVIYNGAFDGPDTVFRVLLFKIFNRVATWEHLVEHVGEPTIDAFDPEVYGQTLGVRLDAGERIYSAAYIMPSPQLGHPRKHLGHLALLDQVIRTGAIYDMLKARSLRGLFDQLIAIPSFGPFLAFQYAIDLNYSPHFHFDEMEFVVPGPGALRGIAKCFTTTGGLEPAEVIRAMTNAAPEYTARCETPFRSLWGRPLQLIDCQNLFCEVDKYARVAFPHLTNGGRSRIKQGYRVNRAPISLGYPPKWGLPYAACRPTIVDMTSQDATNGVEGEGGALGGGCKPKRSRG